MPLNLFLLIIHLIPRWWQYYCSFIFMLVSSLYLNCIYRIHNNFYLNVYTLKRGTEEQISARQKNN